MNDPNAPIRTSTARLSHRKRVLTVALCTGAALGSMVLLGPPATAATLPVIAATDSSDDSNGPNAIDGDMSTRWSGAGDGVWIRFDLGSVTTVGSVSLALYDGAAGGRRSTSQDGTAWSTVLSRATSSGSTLSPETYGFTGGPARYVRIVGHGNSSSDSAKWTSIAEATVSGTPGVPPPPTQTLGVGGVATPPGAVLVPNQSSEYTIDSGGTAAAPKVYDCQGSTIRGGVLIEADNVVL